MHPQALLTVEYLATVVHMEMDESREEYVEDDRWAEDEGEVEEYGDIAYMTQESATKLECSLCDNSYVYGRTYDGDITTAM